MASRPAHGSLQLGVPTLEARVQPGVVDRDGGPAGEDLGRLLIAIVEVLPALLVGEVEVAVDLIADADRDTKESPHRRVLGREPVGARVRRHVMQAKRLGTADELTEHPVTAREWTDAVPLLLVYAHEDKAGELLLALVENSDRGVARARELARRAEHGVEHRLEVEFGHQGPANGEESAQLRFAEPGPCGWGHVTAQVRHLVRAYRSEIGESIGVRARARHRTLIAMSDAPRDPVLIGYDGYDDAAAAIRGAARLLGPQRATVAYVWESLSALLLHSDIQGLTGTMREAADEFDAGEQAHANEVAARGGRLAADAGFAAEPLTIRGRPKAWPALVELSEERDVAAVVVGSEGLGAVKSAIGGSVSAGLVHHSRRPMLIVPKGSAEDASGRVILAYDGSGHARRAIEAAASLVGDHEAVVQTVWTSYRVTVSAADIGIPAGIAAAGAQRLDEDLEAAARQTAEEGAALATAAGMRASADVGGEVASIKPFSTRPAPAARGRSSWARGAGPG